MKQNKSKQEMKAEGRQILRAMENYQPLHNNRGEAEAQTQINHHTTTKEA